MHDIDNTLMEFEDEMDSYEYEEENEYEDEYEYEYEDEDEYEYEEEYEYEMSDGPDVFSESEEMELAAELLAVADDAELDMFLGKLIKRAGKKIRKFAKSKVGRRLKGVLRKVAKKALPFAGRAVGTAFGGPLGGRIGSAAGNFAGRAFGLELEGLSPEDQEFEVARRVVRMAGTATKKAAMAPTRVNPAVVAKKAIVSAAKTHAPGLLKPMPAVSSKPYSKRSGRWMRRGNKIVLMGV